MPLPINGSTADSRPGIGAMRAMSKTTPTLLLELVVTSSCQDPVGSVAGNAAMEDAQDIVLTRGGWPE